MCLDQVAHIAHAAVAQLDIVSVEDSVKFVVFREMLLNKVEECSAYVSLYILTKWRVEPDKCIYI